MPRGHLSPRRTGRHGGDHAAPGLGLPRDPRRPGCGRAIHRGALPPFDRTPGGERRAARRRLTAPVLDRPQHGGKDDPHESSGARRLLGAARHGRARPRHEARTLRRRDQRHEPGGQRAAGVQLFPLGGAAAAPGH